MEVAKAVLFLASDESRFVTVQNFVVGAATAGNRSGDYQEGLNKLECLLRE